MCGSILIFAFCYHSFLLYRGTYCQGCLILNTTVSFLLVFVPFGVFEELVDVFTEDFFEVLCAGLGSCTASLVLGVGLAVGAASTCV